MDRHEPRPAPIEDPLLPPRRVGRVLARARIDAGVSESDAGRVLGGRWDGDAVRDVEAGRRPVDDDDLRALAGLYGMELASAVPERSRLVVDLEEGRVGADGHVRPLPAAASADEVLERYLALVYSMRGLAPGVVVDLRYDDLDVLSCTLGPPAADVESRLRNLMVVHPAPVRRRLGALAGRALLPVAGVLVAATTAGALVLVPADDSAASAPATPPATGAVEVGAAERGPVEAGPVEIGTAAVQERGPDGGPGPVRVREG